MTRRARTTAATGLAVVVAGLGAAGCGGGGGSGGGDGAAAGAGGASGGSGASGTATLSAHQKAVKFAACIRAHGVADFPDPDAKNDFQYGVSVSPVVWRRAVDACKSLQPPGSLSAKRTPKQQSAGLRFARCIRAHGVKDFPDPVNGEPLVDTYKIPSSNAPGGMTILNAAMDKCKGLVAEAAGR